MRKRIICLLLCFVFTAALSACAGATVWVNDPFDKAASSGMPQDGEVVAENDRYRMEWVSENASVRLVDKETGQSWGTTPADTGEPEVDEFGLPVKKHPTVESAIVVEYLNDSTDVEEQAVSYTDAVNGGRVAVLRGKSGVKVRYYFDSVKIMVPVEYVLRENSVAVRINAKEIEEEEYRVTAVSVMPFWCSMKNGAEDAYLFVPSGSGALIEAKTLSQTGVTYTDQVYGTDPVMTADDLAVTKESVRIPVYGAKNGDTAVCAVIEQAAESAVIEARVGSSAIQYSGVCARFQVRGYSPNYAKFLQGLEKQMNIYSRSMVDTRMTVGFYPLTGENADYAGMAQVYKEYLKENGRLSAADSDTALDLTFIGGATVSKSFLGIPYRDILPATTLGQVQEMLTEIAASTGAKINARLVGFGADGLDRDTYAGGYKINKNLGSQRQLSELSEFCKEQGITLYVDFDILRLKNSGAGYSTLFDTAYSALNKIASVYDYNVATRSRIETEKYSLLKRELLGEAAEKLLNKIKKWDIEGVSLDSLTNVAYSDYSTGDSVAYYSKGGMDSDVSAILKEVSAGYKVASCSANLYAAVLSDVIYDAPTRSSDEQIFTADVPFYQMVFKGYVPMSVGSMNLAENPEKQLLKAVETGSNLGYTVCAEWHKEFIDYNGYAFFGSEYGGIRDSMTECYTGLADYYAAVEGAEIIGHRILENGLRETVFGNGVRVYVNYTDTDLPSALGQVQSGGFVWGGDAQ